MVSGGALHLALLAFARLASVADAGSIHRRDRVPDGYYAPPYYPAPHGGWAAGWTESYAKAKLLVEQMTLAEKVNITAGTGMFFGPCVGNTGSIPRLGFPNLCLQDGPLGVRSTDHVTVFPAGITAGATWDKELIRARGVAIGKEFRGKGANVYLGPSVGALGRKPRGGRNWEGFGTDPVLQGKLGAETIEGVQSQGVIATIKHLLGNEQEMYRMYHVFQDGYSANIDDRTIHELYLWPFADGVHAGVGAAMTAYNAVNGSQCAQNAYLINGLLKDELGFQGFVMSDWFGQISGVPAALAGLDMNMPGDINTVPVLFGASFWQYEMSRAVLNGSVPVDRLNDMATRVVASWYKMGQDQGFEPPNFSANTKNEVDLLYPGALFSPKGVVNKFVDVRGNNAEVARQVAQDGITLLKNDGGLLPLSKDRPLSVFGTGAEVNPDGMNACENGNCNKGTLGFGWGSGAGTYSSFDSPMDALKRNAKNVTYYQTDNFPRVPDPTSDDAAIVFVSSDSGENTYTVQGNHGDRDNSGLRLWYGGDELIKKAAEKYSNVIVVVHTVGPVTMEDWINLPSVKSVLFAHLPGQEAGESLTNVLFGAVSPSGHLPYSIPVKETDYPSSTNLTLWANLTGLPFANFDGVKLPDLKNLPGLPDLNSIINLTSLGQPQDTFSEGLYIDYRYLNKNGIKPRFAFGHGLSYANFSFSNATVKRVTELSPLPPARPVKLATPSYSTDIPPASEAYWPTNFPRIERYLYPFLNQSDADNARAQASKSKYDYPVGYSEVQKPGPAAGGGEGGNPALWDTAFEVSVTVTNTDATHAGKAVAQLYVQFPDGISYDTPVVQLRDFAKTAAEIGPGASQTMTLTVTRRDVSVWDVVAQNWVVPKVDGRFKLWVGDSSDRLFTACYSDTLQCESGLPSPV